MATTFVESPGPLRKFGRKKLLKEIFEMLKFVQADLDKAEDMHDYLYYEGYRDALTWVIKLMTKAVKEQKSAA